MSKDATDEKQNKPLSAQHERFAQEFVIDLNATRAYIRAGYAAKGANVSASRLLSNANVQARITELQKDIAQRLNIQSDDITREYMKIAFADIGDYFIAGGGIADIKDLPQHKRQAVASFKRQVQDYTYNDGGTSTKTTEEFRLHDKLRALQDLGKHIGYFEEHNRQKTGVDYSQMSTEELLQRWEASKEMAQMKVV